ncbi:MAG: stage II sporulation protein P [Eubacteriaceae bacterium]|nr:stage II sporulation protein P [Eubacteriaceae bacterium]
MKRRYSYTYLLLAVILLNIPMSVSDPDAWEEVMKDISIRAIDASFSVPKEKTSMSLSDYVGMNVLSPNISMLSYRQPSSPISGTADIIDDNSPTADSDTSKYSDLSAINSEDLHSGQPKVLIYHTHTTESYLMKEGEKPSSWRSTDKNKNLLSVGSIVSEVLHDEYGIQVLHITKILDQPYDSAYDRSYDVAKAAVEKYPSIEYIFDIHRDGLANNEANRQVYLTEINGQKCASIMFVMSTKSKYIDNMRAFGSTLQKKMNELYPGLFRRNMDRPYKYNLEFRPNSMLFEVGSNLTTVAEARCAAVYLGRSLGEVITASQGE